MQLFKRLFRQTDPRDALIPLYNAVVAEARDPAWYVAGAVPDTIDGRFDMVALVLSLVMFRLEALEPEGAAPAALITELFVNDMDGQLRELGIDYSVGKQIGKMMAALGGRLAAYRDARGAGDEAALREALVRNLYRGNAPDDAELGFAAARVRDCDARIAGQSLAQLLAGSLA